MGISENKEKVDFGKNEKYILSHRIGRGWRSVVNDLEQKSLENKLIGKGLFFGGIFFPGEAKSGKQLRRQLQETDTGKLHVLKMNL